MPIASRPSAPRGALPVFLALLTAIGVAGPLAAPAHASPTAPAAAPATPAAFPPPPGGVADLRADIDTLLRHSSLEGADSGVVVRGLGRDDLLYAHAARSPLVPASTTKLLTAAAALEVLGPDHRFTTTVEAGTAPSRGVVKGDLYLVGTGDPTLTPAAYDELAADIAAAGVHEVTGDLVADDTRFDDQRLVDDWEADDEPYYYAAQISALTVAANEDYDTGVTEVTVRPGPAEGAPVAVDVGPATGYLDVDSDARTGAAGSPDTLEVTRAPGTNTLTVTGSLPADGAAFSGLRTVHEPTDYAAHVFAQALADHGVEVHGTITRGTAPAATAELARRESMELADLLVPFMKLSNNGHAEILVKAIGHEAAGEGSWAAGLAEVEAAAAGIGVKPRGLHLNDGSGLSRSNRMTAAFVVELLAQARDEPWFDVWRASLPVAGHPDRMTGGTLAGRMRGTAAEGNVRAKTGTLTGVSALSGYVTAANGEELAFAVVNNGYPGAAPRGVQDAIAVRLAEFSRSGPVPSSLFPVPPQGPWDGGRHATEDLECSWAGAC
ncbi:D-alanyl-D-alanine carboxypeptidase/D-alanyl-D-alanine endopeptidase [Marinactinospora thermotolerans]|uniref:D-alanyl-D-alanine carboxypeptidase / D-alanyl-D-alanine-endopeptidase (Penicillin-binding protein 4) n=1 Tax=Marinactinospora thermotolerans DSM 45154 TaxID=1122192 RepID=A0A1T4TCN3_9ACTN|nr:D-alanyl-D-alanine carboxypeptidase/D-alanyl-D-alanine-endopeptidase [Marinactinospora thermotolerans]SKA38146.1 D-alanyl-D-alanine carboxypeptidase / D-alanyl-D-alanine-endopeptidase (penicillin-binding protein 4) [Marinactinospora thermotolerans DSM 45154]